jgi:CcmD family protein
LVALNAAEATRAKVHVAGNIDHASLEERKLGGESSYTFDLRDHDGYVLPVVAAGSPPFGFERTEIVVVEGRWRDGAFRATAVLIPGSNRGLLGVMVITLIVWLGLFAYVYSVDRRLKGLEKT